MGSIPTLGSTFDAGFTGRALGAASVRHLGRLSSPRPCRLTRAEPARSGCDESPPRHLRWGTRGRVSASCHKPESGGGPALACVAALPGARVPRGGPHAVRQPPSRGQRSPKEVLDLRIAAAKLVVRPADDRVVHRRVQPQQNVLAIRHRLSPGFVSCWQPGSTTASLAGSLSAWSVKHGRGHRGARPAGIGRP